MRGASSNERRAVHRVDEAKVHDIVDAIDTVAADTGKGDIEITEKFQRSYRLARTPLGSVPATDRTRAAPERRYVVTDAEGRIAVAGVATLGVSTSFQVDLKDRLRPGHYTLSALIAVNGNVMNSEMHRIGLVIPPRH